MNGMTGMLGIFLGGGLGACARYLLSHAVSQQLAFTRIPLGTLAANVLGSLLIGFFFQLFQSIAAPAYLRVAITVGFIGAFTTFSTYLLEIFQLIIRRQYVSAGASFLVQNVLGFAMVVAGVLLSDALLKTMKGGL